MTPETRALAQAGRLRNLVAHLEAHPYLTSVIPHPGGKLQVETNANPPRALVEWADSLTEPIRTQCRLLKGSVFVYVTGWVGERVEEVWDAFDGFAEYMEDTAAPVPGPALADLDLDLLRSYADAYERAKRWVAGLADALSGGSS